MTLLYPTLTNFDLPAGPIPLSPLLYTHATKACSRKQFLLISNSAAWNQEKVGYKGTILEMKWGEECIYARNGHFVIAGFISSFCPLLSFPQYQALHILSQILQGMYGYLHTQKENILPVRIAKLSLKTHTGLFVFIL